jgi:hypothetical protein
MSAEAIASFLGAGVTGIGAILVFFQIRTDDERSRRELAVSLLKDWTLGQKMETSAVSGFVGQLSKDNCRRLAKRNPDPIIIEDTPENRETLRKCLEARFGRLQYEEFSKDNKILVVSGEHVAFIRFNSMLFLNLLESILAAWNSRVAHTAILEDQFKFLIRSDTNLKEFRNACFEEFNNTDPFPSITNFVSAISPGQTRTMNFVDRLRGWN